CLVEKYGEKIKSEIISAICKKDPDCKDFKKGFDLGKAMDKCFADCQDTRDMNFDGCVDLFCKTIGQTHPALKSTCKAAGWFKGFRDCVLTPVLVETTEMACDIMHGIETAGDPIPPSACAADRKSTRLNSSHVKISYAVFCLKKKNKS